MVVNEEKSIICTLICAFGNKIKNWRVQKSHEFDMMRHLLSTFFYILIMGLVSC